MYRYIGNTSSYALFGVIGFIVCALSSLCYFKSKQNVKSLYSSCAVYFATRKNVRLGKIVEVFLFSFESLLMVYMIDVAVANVNRPFGQLVGTGANYFGGLFAALSLWFVLCNALIINPLKQIDITTMYLPVHLFFAKIACFCQGCCWGIPWEYGPYNHHPNHPGNQVPVQAIEAFFALAIFIFLLVYRKKAKTGTMFPIYVILYSATRFFSEFLTAAYPDVLGPFNMYQILCVIGIAVGLLMLLIVKHFGDRIQAFFEKPHKKFELKVAQREEREAIRLTEEKAQAEIERLERLEKAKLARQKAKARKR